MPHHAQCLAQLRTSCFLACRPICNLVVPTGTCAGSSCGRTIFLRCLLADQPFRPWLIFCHRDVIASSTLHIFLTAFTTIADCFAIVVVLCLFVRVLQITGCFIALVRVSDGGESIWAVISCSHSVRVWSSLTNRWATCQSRSLICGHSNAIHCYFLYILRVAFAPAGACPNV